MEKSNHIACLTMAIGELFGLVAKSTADACNGIDQKTAFMAQIEKLENSVKSVRYYASLYFGVGAGVVDSKLTIDDDLLMTAPVDLLFDVAATLMSIASREMDFYPDFESEKKKMNNVEKSLDTIEKMIKAAKHG